MSNTLTIALASLGGIVVAGLVAHGAWSAHKANPKRASPPPPLDKDREPVLEGSGPLSAEEPAFELPAVGAAKRPPPRLDALIDALATISLEAPLSAETVLGHLPATRRVGSKVFMVEGLNTETGDWEAPAAGQRYSQFQAGVQLANRTGALNEIEYSEFVQRVQAFVEATAGLADVPDMLEVTARARELDGFASQHDAQLAVHLHARDAAWSVGYIQQHARRHGFIPGAVPGRLVLPSQEEGGPAVLTLTFDPHAALAEQPEAAAVRDVTLSFDVPQTDAAVEPFATWQSTAQALALAMEADIVDDDGRPLSADGFVAIGAELGQLYDALAARDLAAGSATARRVFS